MYCSMTGVKLRENNDKTTCCLLMLNTSVAHVCAVSPGPNFVISRESMSVSVRTMARTVCLLHMLPLSVLLRFRTCDVEKRIVPRE